jgi:hypothetical protein
VITPIVYAIRLDYNGEGKGKGKPYKHGIIWCIAIFLFGLVGKTFIPTTKEAIFIYAGGKTADYINNNKYADSIPDKALQTIDKTFDYLNNKLDKKDSTNVLKNKK